MNDPEAGGLNYSSNKYNKPSSGSSINFFASSTPHLAGSAKAVSAQFDKFAYTLIIIGIVDLVIGCLVLTWSGLVVTTFAIITCMFSWWWCSKTVSWIMRKGRGTHDMQVIADYIQEGSDSYLATQYKTIASIAVITAVGLIFIYMFRGSMSGQISTLSLAIVTALSFMIGAFCSALAGYTGVWTSVRCNLRVAAAAAQYIIKIPFCSHSKQELYR